MADTSFDLVVIGAGPGGYHAAIRGAQLGLKVALVEKDDGTGTAGIGGVCLNWGCIPSKALLKNAELVNSINHDGDEWGLSFSKFEADMGKAVDRSRDVSKRVIQGLSGLIRKNKIELIMGKATLKSSTQVAIEGGDTLTAKNIVIATGARARSLPGLEIDGESIITSRNALELKEKPKAIAIVGASAIGCEFAYYFNAYGVQVMMFEVLEHLVPKEDEDISKELERQFDKQGISFATGAKVKSVDKKDGRLLLKYDDAEGKERQFTCDKVMLGVGVQPNTDDIGLEDVGVELDRGFIQVNDNMQTNVNGVYAVGDVTGKLMLAHTAFDQGVIAAETVAGHEPMLIEDYSNQPRCTYCQPEIASIGLTEKEARDKGISIKIGKVPFAVAGKTVAVGHPDGFAKVIANEDTGEIVGAHIIGTGATEMIAEVGMLRLLEGTNLELHKMTHAHPTLSEVIKEAGAQVTGEAIHF